MPSLKDIRNRIKSVKNVRTITKAMKMVAAAKLKKSEQTLNFKVQFADRAKTLVSRILQEDNIPQLDIFHAPQNPSGKKAILVLSGDKGLCGPFNTNVIKKTQKYIEEIGAENILVYTVGKKAASIFNLRGIKIEKHFEDIFGNLTIEKATEISDYFVSSFENSEFDSLEVIYNRYKPRGEEATPIRSILPLSPDEAENDKTSNSSVSLYLEPSAKDVLDSLIPFFITLQFFTLLIESETAEYLARMTAMDSAEKNATDLIGSLTLEYNQARQAAITKEILEIVSGAEALKD